MIRRFLAERQPPGVGWPHTTGGILLSLILLQLVSGLLLAVVALAWRWPCVGTAAFLVFALLIGAPTLARGGAPWLFCLPMLLISGLYFLAWRVK